jgi:ABC-2 type transport system ATP-binding protein
MTLPVNVRHLRFSRGRFSLDIPEWRVEPGTIVGLVGRNGAGKTTLLSLLAGQLAPVSGEVRVFGIDPVDDPVAVRRRAALMTDDMPVFAMGVGEHLRALAPFWPTWDAQLAQALLTRFELDPVKRTTELSKGEHTRFRLVAALAWRPELLMLDEPATGLDVPSRRQMLAEVIDVVRDGTRAVIISSHQTGDLERICDRVVLIDDGRIVQDGSPAEVAGEGRTLEEMLAEAGR